MSERYGSVGELPEVMSDFEDWVRDEAVRCEDNLRGYIFESLGDPRYDAGRLSAFRDILSWWCLDGSG